MDEYRKCPECRFGEICIPFEANEDDTVFCDICQFETSAMAAFTFPSRGREPTKPGD